MGSDFPSHLRKVLWSAGSSLHHLLGLALGTLGEHNGSLLPWEHSPFLSLELLATAERGITGIWTLGLAVIGQTLYRCATREPKTQVTLYYNHLGDIYCMQVISILLILRLIAQIGWTPFQLGQSLLTDIAVIILTLVLTLFLCQQFHPLQQQSGFFL